MATMNIHTVLALFFVIGASEASTIKGLGTGWQTEFPEITNTQANTPPPVIRRPALPIAPLMQSAASDTAVNLPPMPIGTGWQTAFPEIKNAQGNTPPPDIRRPALPIVPSMQSAASDTGVNLPPMPTAHGLTNSLPSKPAGLGLPVATTPKEETLGLTVYSLLAGIPGYDERCNMQATTAKSKCKKKPGGKKRHRRWYLDPTSKKCLASCDEKAPFRYKMHCDAICRTERACNLAATRFPCGSKSLHSVFSYNPTQNKCVKGLGCDYYGNKFVTLKECKKTCEKGGLQQAQKQVIITTGASNESLNQIPTPVPLTHGLPAPSLPGASIGQFSTGNEVAAGRTQVESTVSSTQSISQASMQSHNAVSSSGQQQTQTPAAVPSSPAIQVAQVVAGGTQQTAGGAEAGSQASLQTRTSSSTQGQQPAQRPTVVPPGPGLQVLQVATGKPSSSGATSAPRTTSQGSSSGSPVRHGQVSTGSGIPVSPELEIVGAGTGPRRNQVTTTSRPSDTSEESMSLDLGLGGPRRPLNTGATSVSRTLSRARSTGLRPRLGPVSRQFGALVSPELEIVGVGTGRVRRPPSGPRANRRSTGTRLTNNSGKPGNLGVGAAPPRLSSTSGQAENQPEGTRLPHIPGETPHIGLVAGQRQPSPPLGAPTVPGLEVSGAATSRGPTISSGTNAQITGSTAIPGIPHPGLNVQPGLGGPQTTGPAPISGTTGASASETSNIPDNLDLGLTTTRVSSHTGSTSSSTSNAQGSGFTENVLTVKHGQPGGGFPSVPPVPGTSKEGPIKTGTIGPQAPSFPVLPVASVLQKPSLPPTPPLTQNLPQKQPTTQKIGTSEEGPVKTGTIGPQAPTFPVLPVASVLQRPSLPPTPSLNQNLLEKRPTTQKIVGTSEEGPVKTGTSGPHAPSLPVLPVPPVLQTPSLPLTPPLNQNLLQQRPTTKKGGTIEEGAVKTGTSSPQIPSLPVNPLAPALPKPNLPAAPLLHQIVIQKRPTTQKIESQTTASSQAITQGSLNDKRLAKRIQKGGNEGIQIPVSEHELPVPAGPLNEPPLKGFSLTMLPKVPVVAKLPGLLKIKSVRK